ncbi:MAG: hypothetical protein C4308_03865 [Chitinophagaceae bacterium]
MLSNIQYLQQQEIDKQKWDDCINEAENGLIYAYSFYLDHMAGHWDALVLGDYEAVMPLTWNKKFGIHYLYQPFLCAQLGLFGNNLSKELVHEFLLAIPKKFKYWDIYLNHKNVFELEGYNIYKRSNYILSLNKPYKELYSGYRENIRRNIKKAKQLGCEVVKHFDAEKVIHLATEQMKAHRETAKKNVNRFRQLFQFLKPRSQAKTYGIATQNGELISSAVFFLSHNRAYYILVGNHPNGRTIGASHALIDAFIQDHSGKKLLLDFEGSDIRNLAFFYSSFGAMEEKFAGLKMNRLPFYLKWLKR